MKKTDNKGKILHQIIETALDPENADNSDDVIVLYKENMKL